MLKNARNIMPGDLFRFFSIGDQADNATHLALVVSNNVLNNWHEVLVVVNTDNVEGQTLWSFHPSDDIDVVE